MATKTPELIAEQTSTSKTPKLTAGRASTSKTPELTAEQASASKTPELTAEQTSTSKTPELTAEQASTSKAPELTAEQAVPNYRRTPLDMASLLTDGSLNPLLTMTRCNSGFSSIKGFASNLVWPQGRHQH